MLEALGLLVETEWESLILRREDELLAHPQARCRSVECNAINRIVGLGVDSRALEEIRLTSCRSGNAR